MSATRAAQPDGDDLTPVFVGLDFGTTFSGLSYVVGDVSQPATTLKWSEEYRLKFPSKVACSDGNTLCGIMIPPGGKSIQWFKLSLLHRDDLDIGIRQSSLFLEYEAFREGLGLRAEEVAEHLFRYMWKEFLGRFLPAHRNATHKYFLTIAVPARWPRYAMQRIREAISASGVKEELGAACVFVSEPEATILASINQQVTVLGASASPGMILDLQVDDIVLVCDCGGGTVDIGGYEMSSLDPPVMNECIPGACKFNGALKLDDRFIALLESKINGVRTHGRFKHRKNEHFHEFAQRTWYSDMKINFGKGQTSWFYEVPPTWLPTAARNNPPQIEFTIQELTTVFEPVMNIAQLVEEQIRCIHEKMGRAPKFVLVSGGFGLNRYLRQAISERVQLVSNVLERQIQTVTCSYRLGGAAQYCALRYSSDPSLEASATRVDGHVVRASYGIQPRSGATPSWFVREGETLSRTRRPRLNLDPTVFKITRKKTDGTAILELEICLRKQDARTKPCLRLEWNSGVDVGAFVPGSPGIQLEPRYDGFQMGVSIIYKR
ncbi:hypothetical protein AK830_g10729 [Neonectria ditissima]|uniref:Actin-like ATPase domain-containing protein n=1 Tax=Neonectria ditissima TaxID=78410 RepID=A0A0P7B5T3_9HYPO|nr:hypothetical protein AK830_g10729 [Neonectria ditissima]